MNSLKVGCMNVCFDVNGATKVKAVDASSYQVSYDSLSTKSLHLQLGLACSPMLSFQSTQLVYHDSTRHETTLQCGGQCRAK